MCQRKGISTFARYWLSCCVMLCLWSIVAPVALVAQSDSATPTPDVAATPPSDAALVQRQIDQQIERFLQAMTPEDRVGQLFVVAFDGNDTTATSDIASLIYEYRIGGVMLAPSRENFTNAKGSNTPAAVARLTNQLQALAYGYTLPAARALALTNVAPPLVGAATMTETLSQTVTTALGMQPLTGLTTTVASATAPSVTVAGLMTDVHPVNVPLLIGVEQLGDGYPTTALRRNFTPIPSQLALGSTWNRTLVREVGAIVGKELHTVGINLLLGPSLDVTDQPRTGAVGALGVQTFGGDPYWVSKMGRAYIAGIHEGSNNQLAAIASHFPGQGDIDRLPDQEVATVQQTLAELRAVALPPFLDVTQRPSQVITATGDMSAADGLMTSHMRFSAFQGNSTTRIPPISLMPGLGIVLNQEGFSSWHTNGGILMTNALGVPAIRRYYEAPLQEFPYRRVALDAFVAGHDLIYLAHLSADDFWETEKEYIKDIVQFFRERYTTDADFQTQVDNAVRRILQLKLHLYRNDKSVFTDQQQLAAAMTKSAVRSLVPLEDVLVRGDSLAIFDQNSDHHLAAMATVGQVAREAMSLLYPDITNLSDALPAAPQADDRLLIFSDSRLFQECADCTAETALGPEEFKSIITRLYGSDPGATGQLDSANIYGRSFIELAALLAADSNAATAAATATPLPNAAATALATPTLSRTVPSVTVPLTITPVSGEEGEHTDGATTLLSPNERLQQLINEADWIIFAMLDVDPTQNPASEVVKGFLRQQSERLGEKRVIVVALNAPYFLDATEISKLTAYIGAYSKTQPFLESAVRALFRSYTPTGAPAVSVPGTRFGNLAQRLSPDAEFVLPLTVTVDDQPIDFAANNDNKVPVVPVGTVLRLQVDQVLDYNGHPVPDGVPISFHLVYENPEMTIPVEPVLTRNGSGAREVTLEQTGRLMISASAGDAGTATPLAIRVQDPFAEATANAVTANAENNTPTPIASSALPSTITSDVAVSNTLPGVDGVTPLETNLLTRNWVSWDTLIIALLTIMVTLSLLLILQIHILPRAILVHNMLWALICGLGAYILFALGILPGTFFLIGKLQVWSAAVVVFIGMLLPLLWLQLRAE